MRNIAIAHVLCAATLLALGGCGSQKPMHVREKEDVATAQDADAAARDQSGDQIAAAANEAPATDAGGSAPAQDAVAEEANSAGSPATAPAAAAAPAATAPAGTTAFDLEGRWTPDGQACGASGNFVFADGSYVHGAHSGIYMFDGIHLEMKSAQGGSDGDVTAQGPDRITIDWKAWKPVSYARCQA